MDVRPRKLPKRRIATTQAEACGYLERAKSRGTPWTAISRFRVCGLSGEHLGGEVYKDKSPAEGEAMLDLKHPMTPHVFSASGLMDGVKLRGQRMSVSPSVIRYELLTECLSLFAKMRELAVAQFGNRAAFIFAAVNEYEGAVLELAGHGGGRITEDRQDGTGLCPVCGTTITQMPKYRIVLCKECVKPLMAAEEKLDSSEGFGTWGI